MCFTQVVKHPRIDTPSRESQLFTDTACALHLDLNAFTPKAAATGLVGLPFTLTAARDERLFALLVYFDVAFSLKGQVCAVPSAFTLFCDLIRPALQPDTGCMGQAPV